MPKQRSLEERKAEAQDKLDKLDLKMKIEELRRKMNNGKRRRR